MNIQNLCLDQRVARRPSRRFAPRLLALWLVVLPLSAFPQPADPINEQLAKNPLIAEMLRDNPLQAMAIIAKLKYDVSADPYDGNNELRLTEHAGGECAKRGQTVNQECIDRGVLDWDCRQRHNPNPNETPDQCIARRLAAGPTWSGFVPETRTQAPAPAAPKPPEAPREASAPALGDDPDAAGEGSAEDAPAASVTDESAEPVEQADLEPEERDEGLEDVATDDGNTIESGDASKSPDDETLEESSDEATDESTGDEEDDPATDDAEVTGSEEDEEAEDGNEDGEDGN
jgi:hypothetical protein